MFWDASAESLGIGTSSPDTLLEIVGADPILTIRDTETAGASTNATLRLAESGASDTLNDYWDINYTGLGALAFKTKYGASLTEAMRIDSSGNLGIGTSSPSNTYGTNLHVNSTATSSAIKLTNSSTGTGASDGFELFGSGVNTYLLNREAGFMYFGTSNTERHAHRLQR